MKLRSKELQYLMRMSDVDWKLNAKLAVKEVTVVVESDQSHSVVLATFVQVQVVFEFDFAKYWSVGFWDLLLDQHWDLCWSYYSPHVQVLPTIHQADFEVAHVLPLL